MPKIEHKLSHGDIRINSMTPNPESSGILISLMIFIVNNKTDDYGTDELQTNQTTFYTRLMDDKSNNLTVKYILFQFRIKIIDKLPKEPID